MVTSNQPDRIVEAAGLTKVFKDFWMRTKALAVDDVDFEIHRHEIFGLLGPNGSGKSTIIKMILGLLHKTRGRLSVFGKPPSEVATKKLIGFLPEESYLYRFLNSRETLDYYGKLFGLDHRTRKRRSDELLDMLGLTQVAHRPIGEFSKGMTRRIGLAQALINDPDFLILDEPTSGLDPIATRQVKDLLLDLRRRGKTILLSSHLLADVEDVCDRMVMLYGGKIRAEGTADELLSDTEHTVIRTQRLQPETIARIEELLESAEGAGIDKVQVPRQRLEDFFMDMVERAQREQVATSGARHGGRTAAFLRGETEAVGEALIDSLVRDETVLQQTAAASAQPRIDEAADDTAHAEVLAELLVEEPTPPATPARRAADTPAAPVEVDESVIDSLLGAGSEDDEDDRDRTSPPGER